MINPQYSAPLLSERPDHLIGNTQDATQKRVLFIERVGEAQKKKNKLKIDLGLRSEDEEALLVKGTELYCFKPAHDVHETEHAIRS